MSGQHDYRQPTRVPVTYTHGAAVEAAGLHFRLSLLHTYPFTFFSAFSQHTSRSFTFLAVISWVSCVRKLFWFVSVFLPVLLRAITITCSEIWRKIPPPRPTSRIYPCHGLLLRWQPHCPDLCSRSRSGCSALSSTTLGSSLVVATYVLQWSNCSCVSVLLHLPYDSWLRRYSL